MKRALALILSLVMCLGLLAGCGDKKSDDQTKDENTPLVVGYAAFNEKFSPFFSETEYDQDVWVMTSLGLLNSDRQGQIIMNGIEGETHAYNGTDYTYYGPADCEIVENADGTVDYNFTMRDDIVFSDGEKVTIDDVIFSMYVLCDPTYDGNSTLYAVPIQGMAAYRSGMTTLAKALAAPAVTTPTSPTGPKSSRPSSGTTSTRVSFPSLRASLTPALRPAPPMRAMSLPPAPLGASPARPRPLRISLSRSASSTAGPSPLWKRKSATPMLLLT